MTIVSSHGLDVGHSVYILVVPVLVQQRDLLHRGLPSSQREAERDIGRDTEGR
jgi:hypothetical protein